VTRFRSTLRSHLSVVSRTRGDIQLTPDDRFNADLFGGLIKFYRAMHISVIGHGDRGLT
jgi:3-deoxy-D-manno-octulosonic-acid transferase